MLLRTLLALLAAHARSAAAESTECTFSSYTAPIWAPDSSATHVLLRATAAAARCDGDDRVLARVTASTSRTNHQRSLAAYKLWVNGALAAIGPGRGDVALLGNLRCVRVSCV